MITVIIPTYKPEKYIEECLYSLETQTLDKSQFEVFVILNGEKDSYYTYLQRLLCSYSFNSRLFYTDIAGVSNARNIGLDNAHGEYICFIDDDDYVSPDYLAELLKKSSSDTIALSYPCAFVDGSTNQESYYITDCYNTFAFRGKRRFSYKVRRYFNGPCMKLINMSFIQDRRFDTRFKNGEDALFMFLISDKFRFVDFSSNKAIYYRRIRENSAVTAHKSVSYILCNALNLSWAYSVIYFKHLLNYNPVFYFSRLLASLKTVINHLITNK